MRAPKHIRDLSELGKTMSDLSLFRFRLSGFRATCAWNDSLRVWIIGKVPRTGPTFISCKLGPAALVAAMEDVETFQREFERIEYAARESSPA